MENNNMRSCHIEELISFNIKHLQACQSKKKKMPGIPTGFSRLDRFASGCMYGDVKTSGFQVSDLIVIAGRPDMQESILMYNIVRNIALNSKIPVAIMAFKETKEQIAMYMLFAEAGIDPIRFRCSPTADDWDKLNTASRLLSSAPIFIIDMHGSNVSDINIKTNDLINENGIQIVFIDHFEMIRKKVDTKSEEFEVNEMARSLKSLAEKSKIPVVILSKLTAGDNDMESIRPTLLNLGNYGALNKYADLILLVHRTISDSEKVEMEIICAKNRRGGLGTAILNFINSPCCRFIDPSSNVDTTSF